MKWPTVKLGELCTIVRGSSPRPKGDPAYYGGKVPRLMVGDLTRDGKIVTPSIDFLTEAGSKKSRPMKAGDFIIAVSGQPGQPCILAVDACIHDGFAGLRSLDETSIDKNYLFHFMTYTKQQLGSSAVGAIFKNLTTDQLKELRIPLPPLEEQKRIAAILDKADAIRRKRQQAIELADEFLRSVFLDMFGDPVTNPKEWEVKPLEALTSKIGSGATPKGGKEAYVNEGTSLIRSLNIHDDRFLHKNLAFITELQANALSNVTVNKGDVLLNITGASVCRAAIVDEAILPARVNQHVCIIRVNNSICNVFLLHTLLSISYKRKLLSIAGSAGATREALTKEQIKGLLIAVPPIELQNKFSALKHKVENLLLNEKKAFVLPFFETLSQKAFAGEL